MTDDRASGPLSSNWKRLQQQLKEGTDHSAGQKKLKSVAVVVKRKTKKERKEAAAKNKTGQNDEEEDEEDSDADTTSLVRSNGLQKQVLSAAAEEEALSPNHAAGRYVAVDCEMVGVTSRDISVLARVSIVNFHGEVLLDVYVEPPERVTNWRTEVSGIRPRDMENALPLHVVQEKVRELFKDRIVVGHALRNDLKLLSVYVPNERKRDTARYATYIKLNGGFTPSLKFLAKQVLGQEIQMGEHDSVVDARMAMELFKHAKKGMEAQYGHLLKAPVMRSGPGAPVTKKGRRGASKKRKR